jgi:hypothetical protein
MLNSVVSILPITPASWIAVEGFAEMVLRREDPLLESVFFFSRNSSEIEELPEEKVAL